MEIWVKDCIKNNLSQLEKSIRDLIQIPNEVPINFKKFYNDGNEDSKRNNNYYNNNQNYYGYNYNNKNYNNKNKKYY